MQYRTLGKTNINASAIVFGGIMLKDVPQNDANITVSKAIDSGINYFDVAPFYGDAQYILGPALASYRKDVFLACKTKMRTAAEAETELNESLRALKTDYLDVYQLHAIDDSEEIKQIFAPNGAMETLIKAKQEGKIKHIGFTCHRERSALYLMSQFDFETVMHPLNFLCMERTGKGELMLEMATQKNLGILAIKTLALRPYMDGEQKTYNTWYHPIVNDDELAALAMRYTYNAGHVVMVTPGEIQYLDLMIRLEKENPNLPPLTDAELKIISDKTQGIEQLFRD